MIEITPLHKLGKMIYDYAIEQIRRMWEYDGVLMYGKFGEIDIVASSHPISKYRENSTKALLGLGFQIEEDMFKNGFRTIIYTHLEKDRKLDESIKETANSNNLRIEKLDIIDPSKLSIKDPSIREVLLKECLTDIVEKGTRIR